jgi:hypothetical protein
MKKQQTPLIVGLIAIIVVAAVIIFWQMRPQSSESTEPTTDTPGVAGPMPGSPSQPGGAASPTDEARSRGEFTPAPK